jgi:cysteine synthase
VAGLHDSILDTIGNTPVVRLGPLAPPGVSVYVKLEAFNPLGSVKDRLALGVIEAAEASGALSPGQTVIEATSGNTGLGLAMVCARKGYPLVVTMAENFSVERRRMLRFLGAKVVLTPASEKGARFRHEVALWRSPQSKASIPVAEPFWPAKKSPREHPSPSPCEMPTAQEPISNNNYAR